MATKITWAERILDVTGGCSKCADGCRNCWAIREVWRQKRHQKWKGLVEKTPAGLNWTGRTKLFPEMLDVPLRTRKPTTFFVNSKSDLFHKDVPFEFIDQVHAVIALCPQHTFQILTKRIERAAEYYESVQKLKAESVRDMAIWDAWRAVYGEKLNDKIWPLPNLWLGTSISTQPDADKNIPILLQIPSALRFVSLEPMLERIDFYDSLPDWVIIGCESGPKARLCSLDDIRVAAGQAKHAGVPVFIKQVPIFGRCSKDPAEWPRDLRIQEYPSINRK